MCFYKKLSCPFPCSLSPYALEKIRFSKQNQKLHAHPDGSVSVPVCIWSLWKQVAQHLNYI